MIFKWNNKGFTMVELLVAMAIMGLLVIMAFPTIRSIQMNNQEKKYQEYGNAAISAAKIYTDSYAEDMFEDNVVNQIKVIYFNDLVKKDLLKDINISDSSCINESSITVVKYNTDFAYCLHLKCNNKSNTTKLYEERNRKGSCKKFVPRKVHYHYKITVSKDVVEGDEEYSIVNPSSLGFNFNSNHDFFLSWNTKADGTGTTYNPGDKITIPEGDINLYAITRKWQYYIYFDKGLGNSGEMKPNPQVCSYGSACNLKENKYVKTGYTFNKWKAGDNSEYTDKENVKTRIGDKLHGDGEKYYFTALFRINKVKIKMNANGATLSPTHGSTISLSGNAIKVGNSEIIHTVEYNKKMGTNGLIDYNNPTYVNLTRTGYSIESKKEWNTKANGTGTNYNQATNYEAKDFCSTIANEDCDITLYANWNLNPPTCTLKTKNSVPASGWFRDDETINMTTTGNLDEYGLDTKTGSTNKKTTASKTNDGTTTYYGHVKNAASTASCNLTVKLDKTKPEVSVSIASQSTNYNTSKVNVTISASDATSGIDKYCLTKSSSCEPNTTVSATTSTTYDISSSQDGTSSKLTACVTDKAGNKKCTPTTSDYVVYNECSQTVNDGNYTCTNWGNCSVDCGGGTHKGTKVQRKKDAYTGNSCASVETANGCEEDCNTDACCTYPLVHPYLVYNQGKGLQCFMGGVADRFDYDGEANYEINECSDGLNGWICYHDPYNPYTQCFGKTAYKDGKHVGNGYGHVGFRTYRWAYIRSTGQAWAYMCNSDNECITYHESFPYWG